MYGRFGTNGREKMFGLEANSLKAAFEEFEQIPPITLLIAFIHPRREPRRGLGARLKPRALASGGPVFIGVGGSLLAR